MLMSTVARRFCCRLKFYTCMNATKRLQWNHLNTELTESSLSHTFSNSYPIPSLFFCHNRKMKEITFLSQLLWFISVKAFMSVAFSLLMVYCLCVCVHVYGCGCVMFNVSEYTILLSHQNHFIIMLIREISSWWHI